MQYTRTREMNTHFAYFLVIFINWRTEYLLFYHSGHNIFIYLIQQI